MVNLVPVVVAFVCAAGALASGTVTRQNGSACVVIYDERADATWRSDAAACRERLSPASTFKIPHALLALERGAIAAATIEKWDGTQYAGRPLWEKDHHLESAIQNSVLWFFQRTAARIGAARMREYLQQIAYGNADTSGPVDRFWINGRLKISAEEQVAFLRRFYAGRVPISPSHIATVQRALMEPERGVQNATGVHILIDTWPPQTELSGKTGAGQALDDPQRRVSWLVGRLTAGGRHYLFASNVTRRGSLDPLEGSRLAFRTFRARGLM